MKLPRIRIADSGHFVVHEAYVFTLESREKHLSDALRDALSSFKITQSLGDYAANHWSNRAEALLSINETE